jgi:hypothetical protein
MWISILSISGASLSHKIGEGGVPLFFLLFLSVCVCSFSTFFYFSKKQFILNKFTI